MTPFASAARGIPSSARPMDSQAKAANMASIRVLTVCATAVDLKNARPRLLYQIADAAGITFAHAAGVR
jgi:hypothetical protein